MPLANIKPVRPDGPLNPTLYERLTYLFGKVEISSPRERAILGVPRYNNCIKELEENLLYAG
jgi:hypothetical protein